jgi:HSP20 family protein
MAQGSLSQQNQRGVAQPNQRGFQIAPSFLPGFGLFGSLQREVDRLFQEFAREAGNGGAPAVLNLVPSIDVTENDKEIFVTAELPGLERKDVDISVEGDTLTIRGEKKTESEEKDKHVVSERRYGVFLRMLQLPPGIDSSKIDATMQNGILTLRIPKPAQSQARKIEVKEAA